MRRSKPINEPPAEASGASSLQVPLFRMQIDGSSDDGYYTSDDVSNVDENWRHGDLKPDNILRFARKGSKALGTLKIGDLGLAKQHMLGMSLFLSSVAVYFDVGSGAGCCPGSEEGNGWHVHVVPKTQEAYPTSSSL